MTYQLKRTKQCVKCPWRKDVNPHTIPDGYSLEKHVALRSTIADLNADPIKVLSDSEPLKVMACHDNNTDYCIGWLHNQLGRGNNIRLRIKMMNCDNAADIEIVSEQFDCFEDSIQNAKTLEKGKK
jgi:hypothetical protein